MSASIRVLLVDDHALVRRGFRRLLEDEGGIEIAGEAGSGEEAVQLTRQLEPQVVVMDFAMPGINGAQATVQILNAARGAQVLILSMYSDLNYVEAARAAGARGYLLKNALEVELASAIRIIAAGGTYFPAPPRTEPSGVEKLTEREKQVLRLIAQGRSSKEIAAELGVSVNTVAVHRANLMSALDIHKTAELVLYAVRIGLVAPP